MPKKKRASPQEKRTGGRGAKMARRTRTAGNGQSHSRHMIENLEEGLLSELADGLNAERQLQKAIPKFTQAAQLPRLKYVLERYAEVTEDHTERLEQVFDLLGRKPQSETCEGIQGILEEAKEVTKKAGPGPVRDALIIAAVQKLGHYKIAMYGTLCAWAEQTKEHDALGLFEESLYDERTADRYLTRIAETSPNRYADEPEARGRREAGRRSGTEREMRQKGYGE